MTNILQVHVLTAFDFSKNKSCPVFVEVREGCTSERAAVVCYTLEGKHTPGSTLMFVPVGWEEENKLSILPYNSRLLPVNRILLN